MKFKKLLPLIGIILLIYILSKLDFTEIARVFSTINPIYVIISFGSVFPLVLFANYEWQLILKKHKINVSYWYSLKNIFIGYFYGFITPGGIGAYTRAAYLKEKSGQPLQKCFVNILIFNTIDYIALLFLAIIGAFVLSSSFPNIFITIIIIFILMISISIFFIRKNTGKVFIKKILQFRLFSSYKERWSGQIDNLYDELPKTKDLIFPFIIAITGWIVWFSMIFLISRLFGIDVPYQYFILIVAVANVIASIPISIYGLGTREIGLIGLLSTYSIAAENIVSLSLFWFVIIWVFPSIIGAFVTVYETKNMKPDINKK